MPRPSQDPAVVAYGSAAPVAAPIGSQIVLDPYANQWVLTLRATGGAVTVVTTVLEVASSYVWWYLPSAQMWVRDVRPWNVASTLSLLQDAILEDLSRARVGASGVYLQLPQVSGPGTLEVFVTPIRGGA